MIIVPSKRVGWLPKIRNSVMDEAYALAVQKFGKDFVASRTVTIGNPSKLPPQDVLRVQAECAAMAERHGYVLPSFGRPPLLKAATNFRCRHNVPEMSPEHSIVALKGSRQGLADIVEALTDEGDLVAMPAWHYPGLLNGAIRGYCKPVFYSVDPSIDPFTAIKRCFEQAYHDYSRLPRLLIICPVGNPVCTAYTKDDLRQIVEYVRPLGVPVLSDEAYIYNPFLGEETWSLMEVPGGAVVGISLFTASKIYSLPDFRVAFGQGNTTIIDAVRRLDSAGEYGHGYAIEQAMIEALKEDHDQFSIDCGREYGERFGAVAEVCKAANVEVHPARAGMFATAVLPPQWQQIGSVQVAARFLATTGNRVNPGAVHGEDADNLLRLALIQEPPVMSQISQDLCTFLNTDPDGNPASGESMTGYTA